MARKKAAAAPPYLFPVVGIGASAGGLAAVTELLKELPPGLGAAVVIIQHLDPEHGSLTGSILSRISPLPVSEITDGMRIEAAHVYVIPPNRSLRLEHGLLTLSPRAKGRQHLPIDLFFDSLARECRGTAIGVVLSGIASDGTNGLRAIKAAGGFTFAQDPSTAQHDGMPRSAISSGAVDTIDTPGRIANAISKMVQWSAAPRDVSWTPMSRPSSPGPDGALREIFTSIRKATGVDVTHYKTSTIRRRIGRRLALHKIGSLQAYADYLDTHPEEVKALFDDVLIHVTSFFRDPKAYEVLKTRLLPKYMETLEAEAPFRIWVPGCSSGQEAYSIAMVFFEVLEKTKVRRPLQVFASDISDASLQEARAAVYPESIAREVSKERLRRFFDKVEKGYRVAKWIRETCLFSKHDLTADPPFAKIDLISCRNVLIYFGPELQKHVIPVLHYALKPGGIFWLGRSETLAEFSNLFAIYDKSNKFYVKKNVTAALTPRFPLRGQSPDSLSAPSRTISSSTTLQDLLRESERVAVREYAPPGVVIDDSFEILHVHGRLTPYLELPPGRATLNVLKLAHPELVSDLRKIIESARREKAAVRTTGLALKKSGAHSTFDIRVVPLQLGAQVKDRYFSVFFEEPGGPTVPPRSGSTPERRRSKTARRAIVDAHADRALIEQYQAAQEELTATNEELQSTNEELQSTNEELETAKEELQSANEELTTINDELQARNAEMAQLTNDLTNLLASLDTPIVMVGADARIRRYTPKAAQLFSLIPGDVGRPIGDIKPAFPVQDLDELAADVMASLTIKELETEDKHGARYRLQVRPYRTADNRIDGAVFALTDITALKLAADVLTIARDDARKIIETMPEPILVVASDLRVQTVNRSYCRMFQVEPSDTEGRLLPELCDGAWNIPTLLDKLEVVLRTGTTFNDLEIAHEFPRIGQRFMVLHATVTRLAGAGTNTALLAIEDLTARKEIADRLRLAEDNYRHLLENAHDGVLIVDQNGVIEFANRRVEKMFGYASGELNNKSYELLVPAQYTHAHRAHHAGFMDKPEARDMGRNVDLSGVRKDGTIIPVEISLSPVQLASHVVVTAILRDISARRKLEDERRDLLVRETEARRSAERANQVKDEFLATLSHELRTPLTTILSWLEILRLKPADVEQTRRALVLIEKSAKDQGQIIEDLLDVSRIQAGKVRLELHEIDPDECIAAVLESVRNLAESKSIKIDAELDSSSCRMEADSARLQQVFRNLLTNAIKFTSPGGRITVRSIRREEPRRLEIQVRDTGKGIRPDFLPFVFKPFSQEDSSLKRPVGGLGLGLSIARNLVDMHRGTLTADSPGEGKGAIFTVTLPCGSAGRPRGTGATVRTDLDMALPTERPAELNGLRVLIIEDREDAREALSVLLESLGADVKSAEGAREGLVSFASDRPDVVLCDLALPGEDGFSVIREIRALAASQGGKVPVVAVTAHGEAEIVQRCFAAGFDAHLTKPLAAVDLARLIVQLAGRSAG